MVARPESKRDDQPVERGIDALTEAVAALSRAAGTALDPTAIVERTMAVLQPVLGACTTTLLFPDSSDPRHPSLPSGAHTVVLGGHDRPLGELLILPEDGSAFAETDRALLDLAGAQIAGALERSRLFQEVMELERLKSDFIARVSHELRTPITIINGFLDTLLTHEGSVGPDQRRHMLERSQVAAARLSGLIEELLMLSRLDAGVLTPDVGRVDVAGILAGVRDAAVEPEQVLVDATDGGTLHTDGVLLARALGLVVDNAIKYGGTAEISAVGPVDPDGRWTFEVRDRGAGFADDVRATAFEMFTRGAGTTAVPGLGVGLPITRTLLEVLDGDIAIDDVHTGRGALLRITLPGPTRRL